MGENQGDYSGWSVSLSADGDILAVGARLNDGNGANSGHVRVFAWNGAAWAQRGLDIDGEAEGDLSGWAVDLSDDGSVLAIGAPNNDGKNGGDSGHVRVYVWNGAAWIQRGEDIDGEAASDYSGYSVSLSGDGLILAIGAHNNDGNGGNSGQVRVYAWDTTNWQLLDKDINGEAAGDQSGWAVDLSTNGTVLAVGARLNDANGQNSGHVRVYTLTDPP